jgi:hypothetical protein
MNATLAPTDLEVLAGLAVTERCCREDLGEDSDKPLDEIASRQPIVDKFISLRSRDEEGQEALRAITDGPFPVFTLHAGRERGITAPDRRNSVVWLLGTGVHRGGHRSDSYAQFVRLNDRDKLFPTAADYERLFLRRNAEMLPVLLSRLSATLSAARQHQSEPQTVLLPGGLVVSLLASQSQPDELGAATETLWLAVAVRGLPPGWLSIIQAALTPGYEEPPWEYVQTFPGRGPDRSELRFYYSHGVEE